MTSGYWSGLFTQHVGTKFLALLLAVLLFTTVHGGLSDEKEYDITLNFTLDAELDSKWVLLTPTVEIAGLAVRGSRRRLDVWAQNLGPKAEIEMFIDEEFLRRYAKAGSDLLSIRLDPDFFTRHALLPEKITVRAVPPGVGPLQLDARIGVTLKIGIPPEEEAFLELDPSIPFSPAAAGGALPTRRVKPVFEPRQVELSGPRYVLGEFENRPGQPLYVQVADVNDLIRERMRTVVAEKETIRAGIQRISWRISGIETGLGFLRVENPRGSVADLAGAIRFEFDIQQTRKKATARDLPLHFRVPGAGLYGPAFSEYTKTHKLMIESMILEHSEDWKTCKELDLLVPESLLDEGEFPRSDLFVVVLVFPDQVPAPGDTIVVEVRLEPADPDNEEALRILEQIDIALNEGASPPARVRFAPK
ncbi:MAG: hypothetical protein ACE5JG_10730 [Planctomycetota bacterium]